MAGKGAYNTLEDDLNLGLGVFDHSGADFNTGIFCSLGYFLVPLARVGACIQGR